MIDLKQLAAREGVRVEWKENVANIEQVIKTIVAFANDIANLGGGYVVCGAREGKDEYGFQKVFYTGLPASRLNEIEGKVINDCRTKVSPPIIPVTEEIPVGNGSRILVFIIAATGNVHTYRAGKKDSSTYYIRIGRETREARNSMLTELLVKKNQLEPWDRRVNNNASLKAIDLIILREYLEEMELWSEEKSIDDYLSGENHLSPFISPLCGRGRDVLNMDKTFPRNFALLMFCREPMRYVPGAFAYFSKYPGTDRSEPMAIRHEVTGPIVKQARRLIELLENETYTVFDKTSAKPNKVRYPLRALQEGVINALVHRDYESYQPIRVTVFTDRIEINSPGSLPRPVKKEKLLSGKVFPFWKNQALAYFFNKLQLSQAEGQGIPTMFRTMKENGNPAPVFEFEPENVICTFPACDGERVTG